MEEKEFEEEKEGLAKVTPGFNLPAKFVIHTGLFYSITYVTNSRPSLRRPK